MYNFAGVVNDLKVYPATSFIGYNYLKGVLCSYNEYSS